MCVNRISKSNICIIIKHEITRKLARVTIGNVDEKRSWKFVDRIARRQDVRREAKLRNVCPKVRLPPGSLGQGLRVCLQVPRRVEINIQPPHARRARLAFETKFYSRLEYFKSFRYRAVYMVIAKLNF